MKTYNEKTVKEIVEKYLSGETLTRTEQIFHNNMLHIRKANIAYNHSTDELFEMYHCSADIYYFIENILKMKLHTYQKEIINHYIKYKHIIFMNSRQIGFSRLISAIFLWESIFKKDINIVIVSNKNIVNIELIDKIKTHYIKLPFYMKVGVTKWTQKEIIFDNFNRIHVDTYSGHPAVGYHISRLFLNEMAFISDEYVVNYYATMVPTISALKNSKLIISSQPNGENFFQSLVDGSQLPNNHPDSNTFELKRTYWWDVPGRDKKWKEKVIKQIGKENFETNYDLKFVTIRSKKIRRIIEDLEDLEDLL